MAFVNTQEITEEIKKKFDLFIPDSVKKEMKSFDKLEEQYTEYTKPALDELTQITSTVDSSEFASDIPTEQQSATVLGSMTGTGPGYSWSNAPGRIATATEQLKTPVVTGYKVATSITPGGMLFTLTLGAYRAVREYA
jgi:hypothetical protein